MLTADEFMAVLRYRNTSEPISTELTLQDYKFLYDVGTGY
jgi:hypothetical protein